MNQRTSISHPSTLRRAIPGVKENVLMREYTTFKIGGRAKYFFEAKNTRELMKAIKTAQRYKLPFFILGGGSNVLFAGKGFNGLMIRMRARKSAVKNINSKGGIIIAEAGASLNKLINLSLKYNLTGLEWAAGIPGTVGGAIYGNAGAFGNSMQNVVQAVKALDISEKKNHPRAFHNKDCRFQYKDSIFKRGGRLIILSCTLHLSKGNKKEIRRKIKEHLAYRRAHQPLNFPSAGSVFKNIKLTRKNNQAIKSFPQAKSFILRGKIPAGFLIERCGLKGKRIGDAQISEKHANFIINLGKARDTDVLKLISLVVKKVKEKFGINLQKEIKYLK